ncbi:MAG: haloacid dehalogenase [Desulfurococcales archaeon]|nr:haloacid dehalogenase [Desulfurococcales archaeon]
MRIRLDDAGIDEARKAIAESVEEARRELDSLDAVREQLIKLSREVIRESGRSIVEIHKGNFDTAKGHLEVCEERALSMIRLASSKPQLLYTGLVNNALSEYVEAKLLYSLAAEGRLPPLRELAGLGVPLVPYLQGLGDLVGELKRLSLELIREGDYEQAWRLLSIAEAVYLELQSLDYPDALIPGVRRKADVARKVVDDLKGLLIDLSKREELANLLRKALEGLDRPA